jgi:hypothetical protein
VPLLQHRLVVHLLTALAVNADDLPVLTTKSKTARTENKLEVANAKDKPETANTENKGEMVHAEKSGTINAETEPPKLPGGTFPPSPPYPKNERAGLGEFPPLVPGLKINGALAKAAAPGEKTFAELLGGGKNSPTPSEVSPPPSSASTSPKISHASAMASGKAVPLNPTTPALAELKGYLDTKTNTEVLRHCLGLSTFEDAPYMIDRIIVVCFDTEGWTADSSKLTEVGFNTFDTRDTRAVSAPGTYGKNLMDQVFFYHIRVQENSHLLNIKYCPGDPMSNRFGQTRFLTIDETKTCLDKTFGWPLEVSTPKDGFCPVILMGHALGGDLDKLQNTINWNPQSLGNVVKIIDTQKIIREIGWWNEKDQAGLPAIVHRCSFTYRNAHTASNDAAMTTIAAIQMVLPGAKKWENPEGTKNDAIQDIIDKLEAESVEKGDWSFGSDKFCLRCGSRTHMQDDDSFAGKTCRERVRCEHCIAAGRFGPSFSHTTERCIQYALAHGNSALTKKTREEKEAKKAKYMRRNSPDGTDGKPAARRSRQPAPAPTAPYGPGGLLAGGEYPEMDQPFGSKLLGPFGKPAVPETVKEDSEK